MIFTFYLAEMTSRNLEEYSQFLRRKAPQFTIRSVLQQNEVIIEPEAAFVIDGAINVVRRMVENTKRFVRFYRGSYIPIGPVYITGHLDRVLPSFFDEISGLPSIVQKVEVIQTSLIDILKMMFNYLNEWKVKIELIEYCANLHISRQKMMPCPFTGPKTFCASPKFCPLTTLLLPLPPIFERWSVSESISSSCQKWSLTNLFFVFLNKYLL